jgi:hypothetical protein
MEYKIWSKGTSLMYMYMYITMCQPQISGLALDANGDRQRCGVRSTDGVWRSTEYSVFHLHSVLSSVLYSEPSETTNIEDTYLRYVLRTSYCLSESLFSSEHSHTPLYSIPQPRCSDTLQLGQRPKLNASG